MNTKSIYKLSIILFLICIPIIAFPQDGKCYVRLRGLIEENMSPAREVKIQLFNNKKLEKEIVTDFKGEFEFKLDTGTYYTVVFSKPGYVQKKLAYNTKVPNSESTIWTNDCAVSMVKYCEGVDVSALDNPIDEIKYHERSRSFKSDNEYTRKMFAELDNIYYELENCLYEKYKDLIATADRAYKEGKLDEAKELYREASESYMAEDYPRKKMYEIIDELKEQSENSETFEKLVEEGDQFYTETKYKEALDKYEEAFDIRKNDVALKEKLNTTRAKVHQELIQQNKDQLAQEKAEQDKEKKLEALLDMADQQFKDKDYQQSKANYEQALLLNPGYAYIKSRLSKLETLLANQQQNQQEAELKRQQELTAAEQKRKQEQQQEALRQQQLVQQQQQLQKQQQYNALMQQAVQFENTGKLDLALEKYRSATSIVANDPKAMQKIAELTSAILKKQVEEKNKKEKEVQYSTFMAQADNLLNLSELEMAKQKYLQALAIKPGDALATSKLKAIDQRIQQEKNAQLAEEQKQQQFNKFLNQGKQYLQNNQLELAKAEFEKAKQLKPNDSYINQNIASINSRLQERKRAQLQKEEKEQQYQKLIATADRLLAANDNVQAKTIYQEALAIKPGDSHAVNKIAEINADIQQQQVAERERLQVEEEYRNYMRNAEKYFQESDLNAAKLECQKALNAKPGDATAKAQLSKTEQLIQQKQQQEMLARQKESQYNNVVASANDLYNKGDYEGAQKAYQQALGIKPGDSYANSRIEVINSNLLAAKEQEMSQKKYEQALKQGNSYFSKADYNSAKKQYEMALLYKPNADYPREKIEEIQRKQGIASSTTSTASKAALPDLVFKNNQERDNYLMKLIRKYPEGITLEVYKEKFRSINRYIIVRDGQANEYREVINRNTAADYYINDKAVNNMYFNQQVKKRDGEYFKKINM